MNDRFIEPYKQATSTEAAPAAQAANRTTFYLALTVLGFVLHEIQWVLLPFVISGLLAYVCTPLIERLTAHTRAPRWAAAASIFIAILICALLFSGLGLPSLGRELLHFVTDLQSTFETLAKAAIGDRRVSLFGQSMNAGQLAQAGVAGIRQWIGNAGQIATLGSAAFAAAFGVILICVLLFYFLLSGPSLLRGVLWLAPPARRPLIETIWLRLDPILKRYFIGVLLVLLYATAAAYIGLGLVLGINHATFLALLTGILEFMPVVGPGASAAIAGIVAIREAKGIGLIVGYAIYAVALRLSIDQFFAPIALGTAARLHPVVIIFSFLAGGVLFGLPGVILAVPVALTVRVTLSVLRGEPADDHKA